jgi:hypothetical protein
MDFPPESQPLGFVFSRSKIKRQIERDERLSEARSVVYGERGAGKLAMVGQASACGGLQSARRLRVS